MDVNCLSEIFKGTLDSNQSIRNEAEKKLSEVFPMIGFGPLLLQVLMSEHLEIQVRQAAVIYLKNVICNTWMRKDTQLNLSDQEKREQDKSTIRDNLVTALVLAPDIIRTQLAVCVSLLVKYDFPERWPQLVGKISIYLQSPDPKVWMGPLVCLHRLVKFFEFKKGEARAPLKEVMDLLFPRLYHILANLMPNDSLECVVIQKQILKIFFTFTHFVLSLDWINKEIFGQWMELLRVITESNVPDHTLQVDEEERPSLIWWKNKKWALRILSRLFEHYGSPGHVSKEYTEFSQWYLKTFSGGILTAILKNLDRFKSKVYISPRVMQYALNYINTAISHAHSWKLIKPHMLQILQYIVFPLMSYTESDAEMWELDPYEYIRIKFDDYEDFVSPVAAAETLLYSACKKRKEMLQKTVNLILSIIQAEGVTPSQKDGALRMIGTMSDMLLKKPIYKEQMETFLVQIVFPEFQSPHGHLRARACWVLQYYCEVNYKEEAALAEAFRLTVDRLLQDKDPPVKVEAAIAIQMLLNGQGETRSRKYLLAHIRNITVALLKMIRETQNEELTCVLRKIVFIFAEELMVFATTICEHLVGTFTQLMEGTDGGKDWEDKVITGKGLLNTMETILIVFEDKAEMYRALEPVILQPIHLIFTSSVEEFYEEAMSLCSDLTSKNISSNMWKMLEVMYQTMFDGGEYFCDLMPVLHNFVTVDTNAFLSSTDFIMCMYNMCKAMLEGPPDQLVMCHAAKLLEVIILQCKGRNIDQVIPIFVELVLQKLMTITSSKLRTLCVQVILAALHYNPQLLLSLLDKIQISGLQGSVFGHFVQQWIQEMDSFQTRHDRKLSVLGLVHLMQMSENSEVRPHVQLILPSSIVLFSGLNRFYWTSTDGKDEEEKNDGINPNVESELLDSDEDTMDNIRQEKPTIGDNGNNNDEGVAEEDDLCEETNWEAYSTPLDMSGSEDEYIAFRNALGELECSNPAWYAHLIGTLTIDQRTAVTEIMALVELKQSQQNRPV